MLPFLAQGANQAIEDVAALTRCLHASGAASAALARYEQIGPYVRRACAGAGQNTSLSNGRWRPAIAAQEVGERWHVLPPTIVSPCVVDRGPSPDIYESPRATSTCFAFPTGSVEAVAVSGVTPINASTARTATMSACIDDARATTNRPKTRHAGEH